MLNVGYQRPGPGPVRHRPSPPSAYTCEDTPRKPCAALSGSLEAQEAVDLRLVEPYHCLVANQQYWYAANVAALELPLRPPVFRRVYLLEPYAILPQVLFDLSAPGAGGPGEKHHSRLT